MAELQQAGCTVIAICKPRSRIEALLLSRGVECVHLPKYAKFSVASLNYLRTLLAEREIGVVHVHFHKDIWLASLALRTDRRRKLFLSVYMGVQSKNDPLHRWIYRRVDRVFSSSHRLNRLLSERYPVPKENIRYLPYGKKLERYTFSAAARAAVRARYRVGDDQLLIGAVSRIDPGKGTLDFAKSFLYLDRSLQPAVKYIIVGEPTRRGERKETESPFEPGSEAYLEEVRTFIAHEGLSEQIILTGHQDDVVGMLSALDLFVFPSHDEMYSLVMLEAMAMGLPIIATGAGGNLEQITDGSNGMLYAVGDSGELAAKISQYAGSPELRNRHGAAARQFVAEHHDMKQTVQLLLEYYNGTK